VGWWGWGGEREREREGKDKIKHPTHPHMGVHTVFIDDKKRIRLIKMNLCKTKHKFKILEKKRVFYKKTHICMSPVFRPLQIYHFFPIIYTPVTNDFSKSCGINLNWYWYWITPKEKKEEEAKKQPINTRNWIFERTASYSENHGTTMKRNENDRENVRKRQ
jgi:hypothetical protein